METVEVRNDDQLLVASRQMLIEPGKRCFCVQGCNCYCAPNMLPLNDHNVCHSLPASEEKASGLGIIDVEGNSNGKNQSGGTQSFASIKEYILYIFLAVLLLGESIYSLVNYFNFEFERCRFSFIIFSVVNFSLYRKKLVRELNTKLRCDSDSIAVGRY